MKILKQSVLVVLLCLMLPPFAQAAGPSQFPFVENLGQLADSKGNPVPEVLYYAHTPQASLYLRRDGFSYVYHQAPPAAREAQDAPASTLLAAHRIDFRLQGSQPSPTVVRGHLSPDYANYYLAHCPEGILGVRAVDEVLLQGIYPGIDLKFSSTGTGIKYDFILRPGADLASLRMQVLGADGLSLDAANALAIQTSLGEVQELLPACYATAGSDGAPRRTLRSAFRLQGNLLSFDVEPVRQGETLVIDPLSTWATFFGGGGFDYGEGVVHSADAVYMAGSTNSATYPATVGAHQTTLAGGYDAHLTKFDLTGNRLWATYYGGPAEDRGMETDYDAAAGMVYVTGYCASGFPTSAGAHQTVYGGGTYDSFLLKFDASGVRQWGTLMGGEDEDRSEGVAVDPSGFVSISGRTLSSAVGSISTPGVVQAARSGNFDSYISRFDAAGVRQWGTYVGGTAQDYGHSITADAAGNVIIVGETYSSNFPAGSSPGNTAHLTTKPGAFGDIDMFIYKINPSGTTRIWATYYGGVNVERGWGVTTDASDNVLACGNAFAAFPVTPGVVQTVYGTGTGDAALVKFAATGARMFATYLGGASYDCAFSVDVTPSGSVVVIGETQSGWTLLNNCVTGCSGTDFCGFVVHLNATATARIMSTKIGGTNNFNSTLDLTVDGDDNIYLCGYTNSTDFPVGGPVVFQPTYGGGSSDAYLGIVNDDSCDAVIALASKIMLQGQWMGNGAHLSWTSPGHDGTGRWWVGRSSDGLQFQYAQVSPEPLAEELHWFDRVEAAPAHGMLHYKVRHLDPNGQEQESEVIRLATTARPAQIVCHPVPATEMLWVHCTSGEELQRVQLLTLDGRQVLQSATVSTGMDVSGLPMGLYALRAFTSTGLVHHALVKVGHP